MRHLRKLDVLPANRKALLVLVVFALAVAFASAPLHSQTFQNMHDFNCQTEGCNPVDYGYLAVGEDNNLYGTTAGNNTVGTIFSITPTAPFTYTDLYKFGTEAAATPLSGLTLMNGSFYGTTSQGGTKNFGVVFKFTPPSTLKVLYNFTQSAPAAPPALGSDGNLYGITGGGQAYKVTVSTGTVSILPNPAPGDVAAPLFLASDTNLYGVSYTGGTNGLGTVFRMMLNGAFDVLYNFTGVGTDGSAPVGPLTEGADGNLYGTTMFGGGGAAGVIFEISLSGKIKTVHSFSHLTDGATPSAGLLAAPSGLFYGVTTFGGTDDFGTIFEATKGGFFSTLFDFTGTSGAVPGEDPIATLVRHTNGNFYGLTSYPGEGLVGTVFSVTPPNPLPILIVEGPIFALPGVPVTILGNSLTQVMSLSFGGVQAVFQANSDTALSATVPMAAVDGLITATFVTGLQVQTASAVHIRPLITNLTPTSGPVGTSVTISGGGFTGARKVAFGGVATGNFVVVSPTEIQATVPSGAKTGKVVVTTPNGTASSPQNFTVT